MSMIDGNNSMRCDAIGKLFIYKSNSPHPQGLPVLGTGTSTVLVLVPVQRGGVQMR